jgi:hypothetical protein
MVTFHPLGAVIYNIKKYNKINNECDNHVTGLIRHTTQAHCPMEHIGGFMQSP